MANLSNINNKFLFTDGDFLKIGNLAPINNISSTESGISVTNSNVASITLDNTAASGKRHVMYSSGNGSLVFWDSDAASARLQIDSSGNATFAGDINIGGALYKSSGDFNIKGSAVRIKGITTNENLAAFIENGQVELYYNNSKKFETTSTGISVSGTSSTFAGTIQTTQITATNGLNYLKRNTDASLQLRSENTRSGLFITKPATDTVMGSALVLEDESYRLGTANYYHMVMLPNGTTYFDGGNVGIGTTSPARLLHVNSSGQTDIHLTSSGQGTSSTDGMTVFLDSSGSGGLWLREAQALRFATSSTERMRVTSAGNVGIGTTSPDQLLDVSRTATTFSGASTDQGAVIRISNPSNWENGYDGNGFIGGIEFHSGDTSEGGPGVFGAIKQRQLTYYNHQAMCFFTRPYNGTLTERMRIDSSGNVGIGTASPSNKLDVAGNVSLANYSGTGENQTILAQNSYGQMRAGIRSGIPYIGSISPLDFALYTGNSEKMRITTTGNVGIGTTSPTTKLQVNGDIGIGEINSTRSTNVRFAKNDTNVITFDISVGAVGAWRPGSCWIQVSGAQNGLQEYWSAWYFIRLTHYYLSGVAGQGTTNPSCILDSGGNTSNVVVGVSSTNTSNPQIITITLTDSGGTTNSMVADINCTMQMGINSIT